MPVLAVALPEPAPGDDEDVVWGLSTASALWTRGEHDDAIVWLRRAADAAIASGQDFRASQLGMAASELEESLVEWRAAQGEAAEEDASSAVLTSASEPESEATTAAAVKLEVSAALVDLDEDEPETLVKPLTADKAYSEPEPATLKRPSIAPAAEAASQRISPWGRTLTSRPAVAPKEPAEPPVVRFESPPSAAPPQPAAPRRATLPPPAYPDPALAALAPPEPPSKPRVATLPPPAPTLTTAANAPDPVALPAAPPRSPSEPPPPTSTRASIPPPNPNAAPLRVGGAGTMTTRSGATRAKSAPPALDPWSAAPQGSDLRAPKAPPPTMSLGGSLLIEVRKRSSSTNEDDDDDVDTSAPALTAIFAQRAIPPHSEETSSRLPLPRAAAGVDAPAHSVRLPKPPPPPSAVLEGRPHPTEHSADAAAPAPPKPEPPAKPEVPAPPPPKPEIPVKPEIPAPPPPKPDTPIKAASEGISTPMRAETPLEPLRAEALEEVPALADLPPEAHELLASTARLVRLEAKRELTGFGGALLISGAANVVSPSSPVHACTLTTLALVTAKGSLAAPAALGLRAGSEGAVVALWARDELESALLGCSWVEDELTVESDRLQALTGATVGPIGSLDDVTRAATLDKLTPRALTAGETVVEQGAAVPGLLIVGAGTVIVDGVTLGAGSLVYPSSAINGGLAPRAVLAGPDGALLVVADRATTSALSVEYSPLLELLSQ